MSQPATFEQALNIREELMSKVSEYGQAMFSLAGATPDRFRELFAEQSEAFREVLRLSAQLRDLTKGA